MRLVACKVAAVIKVNRGASFTDPSLFSTIEINYLEFWSPFAVPHGGANSLREIVTSYLSYLFYINFNLGLVFWILVFWFSFLVL